jgi:hypothetical protein
MNGLASPGDPDRPLSAEAFVVAMGSRLGKEFRSERDQPFLWLTPFPPAIHARLSQMAHHALRRVREILPALTVEPRAGIWPLIVFSTLEEQMAYEDVFPGKGARIINGGCWRGHPVGHFALPVLPGDSLDAALGHELVHAVLHHRGVPVWIQEGIAMGIEYHMGLRGSPLDHPEGWREAVTYWRDKGHAGFWSGKAFGDPESSRHAYALAQVLMASRLGLAGAIAEADWRDEEAALRRLTGATRSELVVGRRLGWFGELVKSLFGG